MVYVRRGRLTAQWDLPEVGCILTIARVLQNTTVMSLYVFDIPRLPTSMPTESYEFSLVQFNARNVDPHVLESLAHSSVFSPLVML